MDPREVKSFMQLAEKNISFPVQKIREEFPILDRLVYGKKLIYLDNAATTHKPSQVLNSIQELYEKNYSNVHRGVHYLSQKATTLYEDSRKEIAQFIHAKNPQEIIFTRGTTEGINLVAHSFGALLQSGDEILISQMEHHSNIVPWQMLRDSRGIALKAIPITREGELDLHQFEKLISKRTKLVAITHVSNALGTINPVEFIIRRAHQCGAKVLIDGAQAISHFPVDVEKLDCDFYVFSGHKMYGPTGIGVLYGKEELLRKMPPYQGGGDMIHSVTLEKTTYNDLPYKFEAGTPNIAGVIGLGSAVDFLNSLDWNEAMAHEESLLNHLTTEAKKIPQMSLFGEAKNKVGVLSFVLFNVHPHDIATILDREGIAVRAGHHCAQPLMDFYQVPATTRASFAVYNTHEEVDHLVWALKKTITFFV